MRKYKKTLAGKETEKRWNQKPENKEKIRIRNKKYHSREDVKKRRQFLWRKRTKNDPLFRLKNNIRIGINGAFKNILHTKKDSHTFSILGISPKELMKYIENKFTIGMTWENYGRGGWEIDHIIPISSAKTKEDVLKLCHYTNLQPLWWRDNLKKSNKYFPINKESA